MEEKIKEVIRSMRIMAANAVTMASLNSGAEQRTWNLMADQIVLEILALELAIGVTK